MSSKTFKDAKAELDSIDVATGYDGEPYCYITTTEAGNMAQIQLDNSTAPALALAILEAAGLTVAKGDVKQDSFEDLMIDASLHLKCAIRLQERATAEAKEQAELEAEALELFNAAREEIAVGTYGAYEQLDNRSRRKWLAVARKAREMRAEK